MTPRAFHSVCLAAVLGVLASPSSGLAGPTYPVGGTTSGVFTNPSPTKAQDSHMEYSYSNATVPHFTGSNQYPDLSPAVNNATSGTNFRWGEPSGFPSTGPNQLWWNANSPVVANTEAAFKLGTISYFNGTTTTNSVPDWIQLKIHLDLSTLNGNPISVSQDFAFTLELITTPNTGTPEHNADYVKFPTSWPSTIFTVGGVDYTLKLMGFENATSGGFVGNNPNEFHVKEGFTATADLMGVITSDTSGVVPEPASIISAAVAGVVGLAVAARRRRA